MNKYIFLLLIIFILPSCVSKNNVSGGRNNNQPIVHDDVSNKYIENEKAKNITNSLLSVEGINKVVVVVTGRHAIIGLNIDDMSKTNYYKTIAVQKTRLVDNNIVNIQISTDEVMYKRISKLNEDIVNDKPITGITQEFINIFSQKKKR